MAPWKSPLFARAAVAFIYFSNAEAIVFSVLISLRFLCGFAFFRSGTVANIFAVSVSTVAASRTGFAGHFFYSQNEEARRTTGPLDVVVPSSWHQYLLRHYIIPIPMPITKTVAVVDLVGSATLVAFTTNIPW